jgi:hypothetical protein
MIPFTIQLDEKAAEFYARIAAAAGRSVEAVLSDSLFKLAGELSLEALAKRRRTAAD